MPFARHVVGCLQIDNILFLIAATQGALQFDVGRIKFEGLNLVRTAERAPPVADLDMNIRGQAHTPDHQNDAEILADEEDDALGRIRPPSRIHPQFGAHFADLGHNNRGGHRQRKREGGPEQNERLLPVFPSRSMMSKLDHIGQQDGGDGQIEGVGHLRQIGIDGLPTDIQEKAEENRPTSGTGERRQGNEQR